MQKLYYHALQRKENLCYHFYARKFTLCEFKSFYQFCFTNNLHLKHDSGEVVEKQNNQSFPTFSGDLRIYSTLVYSKKGLIVNILTTKRE